VKAVALLFALAVTCLADSHTHITRATWLVAGSSLEWETAQYDDNEQRLPGKPERFYVVMPAAIMGADDAERRFSRDEAVRVSGAIAEVVKFFEAEILGLSPDRRIVELTLIPVTGSVEIQVQEDGLRRYEYKAEAGQVIAEVGTRNVEESTRIRAGQSLSGIIRYAMESTQWWMDGQGEPVQKLRA